VKPLRLPPNQVHRFYRGGARIAELRGWAAGEGEIKGELEPLRCLSPEVT
jgi:hypothetical protein